jgi:MFS family permease
MSSPWRNLNVVLLLLYTLTSSLGASVGTGSLFSVFLSRLPVIGGDTLVGFIATATGAAMLALAWPAGALTDRCGRATAARVGGAAGLAAAALQAAALALAARGGAGALPALYASAAAAGAYYALAAAPAAALLADSLVAGERTRVMVVQYSAGLLAGAAGPLAVVIAYAAESGGGGGGDAGWTGSSLVWCLQAGNAVSAAACLFLLGLSDARALGAESDTLLRGAAAAAAINDGGGAKAPSGGSTDSGVGADEPLLDADEPPAPAAGGDCAASRRGLGHQRLRLGCCTLTPRALPYVIFASDLVLATGAGMTVAFFSIFFSETYSLPPLAVAAIFAASPVVIAALALLALPLNKAVGRARACVLLSVAGTACLFGLTFSLPVEAAVALYLLRTGAMNAAYPTQRAIVMDVVDKKRRGLISSLENLTSATWTGSAALGGVLLTSFGFKQLYFVTACIYVASIVILLPIIPLTAGEQVDDGDGEGAAAFLPPLGGDGAVDDAQPPKASHLLPPAPPSLP